MKEVQQRIQGRYSRFHLDEVHPDCSSIAVGTRHCRVHTSVVYLTNLKSAVTAQLLNRLREALSTIALICSISSIANNTPNC